jgi:hypothetical protein
MPKFLLVIVFFFLFIVDGKTQKATSEWTELIEIKSIQKSTKLQSPSAFLLVRLDYNDAFHRLLASNKRFGPKSNDDVLFKLPMPDGQLQLFKVLAASVMEPSLQAKFEGIKSYTLIGITNRHALAKIDFGPAGFHGMIMIPGESTIFIDPFRVEDHIYMCYKKKDYPRPSETFICETEPDFIHSDTRSRTGDCAFRQYRLALACTGEYAQYHGGTVPMVMAAFNTSMNRVNGVYEKDAGITMVLVSNNDQLIYLDGSTDPYTNGNGGAMLGQNQTTCDAVIGTANYDIGHVFSTGGGGVASLRAPCNASRKARGVTGRGTPVGDPFDIDYVAHEMGHQYGGNHTQNNNCNRSNASYEPGSASTIMGYAGICSPNVQSNSDDYFHAVNLAEIAAFVTNNATGGSCDNILSTSNNAPTANAGPDYNIPGGTAFALTGISTDPDGDPITYCWEQYNNEVSTQPPLSTNTLGPSFRTLLPSTSPIRECPAKGLPNIWEVPATVDRVMTFRLTVRDFSEIYGYGCTEEHDMTVTTFGEFGPFKLIAGNGGENWTSGGAETVSWDVANTHAAPISCSQVSILLSIDDGDTYDYILITNTPNDGSQTVLMPAVLTNQARIKIKAVGNIFFDVSDSPFNIQAGTCDDMLVFDSSPVASGSYYAVQSILASVSLQSNANVFMRSATLNFDTGFLVPLGSELNVVIGGCP